MEELNGMTYTETLSGVNSTADVTVDVSDAADQTEETTETTEPAAEAAVSEESGESQSAESEEEAPAAGEDDLPDDRTRNAFAKRMNKEREKITAEVTQRAQAELLEQWRPLLEVAQTEAQKHGMTPLQWANAVQANREAAQESDYVSLLNQAADEYGVDPNVFNAIALKHPGLAKLAALEQQAQQMAGQLGQMTTLQQQASELSQAGINAKDIPDEAFEMASRQGISVLAAYQSIKAVSEAAELKAQVAKLEKALKAKEKNAANQASSPGSVNGQGSPTPDYISKETFDQKKSDSNWVKVNLDKIQASRRAGKW